MLSILEYSHEGLVLGYGLWNHPSLEALESGNIIGNTWSEFRLPLDRILSRYDIVKHKPEGVMFLVPPDELTQYPLRSHEDCQENHIYATMCLYRYPGRYTHDGVQMCLEHKEIVGSHPRVMKWNEGLVPVIDSMGYRLPRRLTKENHVVVTVGSVSGPSLIPILEEMLSAGDLKGVGQILASTADVADLYTGDTSPQTLRIMQGLEPGGETAGSYLEAAVEAGVDLKDMPEGLPMWPPYSMRGAANAVEAIYDEAMKYARIQFPEGAPDSDHEREWKYSPVCLFFYFVRQLVEAVQRDAPQIHASQAERNLWDRRADLYGKPYSWKEQVNKENGVSDGNS